MNGWDKEAARLEALWLAGNFSALIEVVALFGWNGRPLPAWAANAAVKQLERAYNGDLPHAGDGERDGRSSTVMAYEDKNTIHRVRWGRVNFLLGPSGMGTAIRRAWRKGRSRAEVFKAVSDDLAGTVAQGSAGAIEASYDLVEAAIKQGYGARFKVGD